MDVIKCATVGRIVLFYVDEEIRPAIVTSTCGGLSVNLCVFVESMGCPVVFFENIPHVSEAKPWQDGWEWPTIK